MKRFFLILLAAIVPLLDASEAIVSSAEHLQVIIPNDPPADMTFALQPTSPTVSFFDWPIYFHSEFYDLTRKITSLWHTSEGITDYMVYGRANADTREKFRWLVIGYPQEGWGPWKQGAVIWRLLSRSSSLNHKKQKVLVEHYRKQWSHIPPATTSPSCKRENDAFCSNEVMTKQRIFTGNHIDILYNYAPLAPGKAALHFLVVPKTHRATFLDLSREEFLEASVLTSHISRYFLTHGYRTAHIFHKNGVEAGQSVPHWHQHIVFTATSNEDYLFLFNLIKNAIWGPTILPEKELAERVQEYSPLFQTLLRGEK